MCFSYVQRLLQPQWRWKAAMKLTAARTVDGVDDDEHSWQAEAPATTTATTAITVFVCVCVTLFGINDVVVDITAIPIYRAHPLTTPSIITMLNYAHTHIHIFMA